MTRQPGRLAEASETWTIMLTLRPPVKDCALFYNVCLFTLEQCPLPYSVAIESCSTSHHSSKRFRHFGPPVFTTRHGSPSIPDGFHTRTDDGWYFQDQACMLTVCVSHVTVSVTVTVMTVNER